MLAHANIGRGHLGNVYHITSYIMLAHANIGRGHRGNVYHTPVTLMLAHAKHRTGTSR